MSPPPLPGQPVIPPAQGMVYWGDVKVAGTHHEGREDILRKQADPKSKERWQLVPQREPGNPHDTNAVAIIAVSGKRKFHLGYLPKQVAADVVRYKHIGIVPRSIAKDGRYLYVDLFHSKAKSGCLGCLVILMAIPPAIIAGGFLLVG